MATEKRRKKGKAEPVQDEVRRGMAIDAKTHRRVLRFFNGARTPEDVAYWPLNEIKAEPQETLKRPDVDEPMLERPPQEAHRPQAGAAHPRRDLPEPGNRPGTLRVIGPT